jgi:isoquinoline 1-oxidoreductase beta subunit
MTIHTRLSRRSFVVGSAAAGGGLSLGFHLAPDSARAQTPAAAASHVAGTEVDAWVVIKPDDTVVVRIARSEMGQGTLTGLAQLVAEELECDWSKVTTEYPTPGQNLARKRVWGDMSTGGSRGIRGSHDYVRKGGAAARLMLVAAAAKEWGVAVTECSVDKGVVTHKATGRTTTYGAVAASAATLAPPAANTIKLKDPKAWTIAGQGKKRLDTAGKIDGSQIYAIDVKMPGMLNAAISDCPHFGGSIKGYDEAAVRASPGVKHVLKVGPAAIAVVADTWWHAKKGLEAAKIEWDPGPNAHVSSETIAEFLKAGLDSKDGVFVANQNGDVDKAIADGSRKLEAVYSVGFRNHACMEPMNCTALWTADKCEVWVASQNGEASLAACASASGLPIEKCEVYKSHLGGGFGRRGFQDYVTKAVLAAKQVPGVPIKMIWSREEDMLHGRFHPITQCKLTGVLDDKGSLAALSMRISGQSILASVRPDGGMDALHFQGLHKAADSPYGQFGYTVPHLRIDHAMRNTHVPPGFWRGVNHNQNAIYLECFMDEMAKLAGVDPLEFRRKMMADHPKHLAVLNAVAERAEWSKKPAEGVYRGLCQHMGFGSYCAAVAEITMRRNGKVKVNRLVMGTDCDTAVNPEQIAHQVEGSVVYGLGAAFYQENTVKNGRMVEENFDTFPCLTLAEMPKIETVLVPSGGFWGGVGEPTIFVAAPAVMNAIFAATGKMPRDLPLSRHRLV